MKYLDQTYPTPAEDLAADEALLEACEAGESSEGVLRFYHPGIPCVVLGYGNRRASEVDLARCADAGVPVLRRVSGGGTVLLGPGCLAYSLVLPVGRAPELESVHGTNRWIMERQRQAIEGLLGRTVEVRGHTDLVVGDRKFSGNAQRRRSRTVLFHGTFLLTFDLASISDFLRMPSLRPEYRRDRPHEDFVCNLGVPASALMSALREAWGAAEVWTGSLAARVEGLMEARYGRPEWHARF